MTQAAGTEARFRARAAAARTVGHHDSMITVTSRRTASVTSPIAPEQIYQPKTRKVQKSVKFNKEDCTIISIRVPLRGLQPRRTEICSPSNSSKLQHPHKMHMFRTEEAAEIGRAHV